MSYAGILSAMGAFVGELLDRAVDEPRVREIVRDELAKAAKAKRDRTASHRKARQ